MTETTDPQIDALLEALGDDGAEALLAALGRPEQGEGLAEMTGAPAGPEVLSPRDLKAKVAGLAKARPELLAKIITHWITEERRKGR